MGAGSSALQAFPTDVRVKTADGRQVANEIFRYMALKLKYQEYLALGNPDMCKNYVILMADSLEKYFHKMRFFPEKTTSGKQSFIYFRRMTDLKDVSPDTSRFCIAIAYFYIRIFQIYGALAISILDAETSVADVYFGGGDEEEEVQEGGGEYPLSSSDVLQDDFNHLRPYLKKVDSVPKYYKFDGYNLYLSKEVIQIIKAKDKKVEEVHELVSERSVPVRRRDGRRDIKKIPITAYIAMHTTPGNRLNVEFMEITGTKVPVAPFAHVFSKRPGLTSEWEWKDKKIPAAFDAIMSKILASGEGANVENEVDADTGDKDRNKYRYDYNDEYRRRTTTSDTWDDKKALEPYRTRDLWETLKTMEGFQKGRPIKAHCIARALQLVSSRALEQAVPSQIISTACMDGFLGTRYPGSVPKGEEEISKEKGLFVLNQLFYDRILPNLSPTMSSVAQERHIQVTKLFEQVFRYPSAKTSTLPKDFSTIRSKTASALCKDKKDKHIQSSDKELIGKLRAVVKSMLLRQVEHTAKVTLLLKSLFLAEKGKPVQIHPQVLAGGIPVLNKIGVAARELLISYYVNCEKSYSEGIALLEANKGKLRVF